MIHRSNHEGTRLDVAGLNEITVLVDRSETELTEVAMNSWHPGQDGPPHAHPRKEQNFLVTSGHGVVKIGDETFPAEPGSFFFIPAGVIHQSITKGDAPLQYFLFNAFLDADKEGHSSFADHIAKVKETRRRQAEEKRAEIDPEVAAATPSQQRGLRVDINALSPGTNVLLARDGAKRCEAIYHQLAGGESVVVPPDAGKETTFYIFSGRGRFTAGDDAADIAGGQVVFLPRNRGASIEAGEGGIRLVSFGTLVER